MAGGGEDEVGGAGESSSEGEPAHPALHAAPCPTSRWVPWARLLWRVFEVDGYECPNCSGRMRLRALVQGPPATVKVVRSLRRSAQRARPPP